MGFVIADTFHFNDKQGDGHVHVVVSDPGAPEIVVVNLTTLARWKDQSCIIKAGEHPCARHDSCIAYDYAEAVIRNCSRRRSRMDESESDNRPTE